jgi:hypothetical protein
MVRPTDSDDHEVTRRPISVPLSFPCTRAPPRPFLFDFIAGNRAARPRPKLTCAPHVSSRLSFAQQDAIDVEDHAVGFVSTLFTPSSSF